MEVRKIDFCFFDAGGGHRAAATALKAVIEQQKRPWQVRLVNLQDVLDPLDIFRKYARIRMQDVYNLMLRKGWTLGSPQLLPIMHALIRLYHPGQVRLLHQFWQQDPPDLVVSVVPNLNRAIFQAAKKASSRTAVVTILTDLADYPPHFWFEQQEQLYICGTAKAVEQARALGLADNQLFRVSGMILRPRFYEPITVDRAQARQQIGLEPDTPTGLVLFGGHGSPWMRSIARDLERCRAKLQLILLCGHNQRLANGLRQSAGVLRRHVVEFTQDVPLYMHLSDFFVGKPGPGSISEALAMGLPVIVERNAWTLPQERYNTEWVKENGYGEVLRSFRQISPAVEHLLSPGQLQRFQAAVRATRNQAVFEIPDILERILQEA